MRHRPIVYGYKVHNPAQGRNGCFMLPFNSLSERERVSYFHFSTCYSGRSWLLSSQKPPPRSLQCPASQALPPRPWEPGLLAVSWVPRSLAAGDGVRVPPSSGRECRTKHNSSTAEKSTGRVRCALTVRGEERTVSTEKKRINDRGHSSLQRRLQG